MIYKCTLALTAALGICASSVFAQTVWTDANGDWFVPGNWSAGVPNAATTAQIDNGGTANIAVPTASAFFLDLGVTGPGDGNVVISGTGVLHVTISSFVGDFGTGSLTITDAGTMTTGLNVIAGNNANSFGDIEVNSAGASLTSGTNTAIGNFGTGIMNITGGGVVTTNGDGVVGNNNGSIGVVTVDGTNAVAGFPSEWTIVGGLAVGNNAGSFGELFITDGGVVDPFSATIGRFAGSSGLVVVDGSNAFTQSTFTVANNLFVGGNLFAPGGSGELDITNGGVVNVGNNMVVWGSPTNTLPSNGLLAVDHTYTLNVAGVLDFQGGTLRFLDNTTDFINNAVLTTATGPVGMFVDTNGETNIVGPEPSGFPRISGLLSGAGGLEVFGGGTLFLTNFNTYTGDTNVDDANLFIDGSVAGNVNVSAAGLLGGIGFVGGNADIFGTFTPGDVLAFGGGVGDPATFIVVGDATFETTSTYIAEVGSVNPFIGTGNSDLLVTGGTTTILGGTIVVPRLDTFEPHPTALDPTSRTTVIDTLAGRFGAFATLVPVNWPGLIQPIQLTDDPFTLDIGYKLNKFTSVPVFCDNQFRVEEALDLATAALPINVITFLGFIPIANLPHAFDLIAPEEYAAMYEMSFSHAIVQSDNLQRHMDAVHVGATGYCGPVAEVNPPIQDKNMVDNKKEVAPPFVPSPENRWCIWVQGNGDFVDVHNDDPCAKGYEIDNGSVTVGIDYRVLHNLAIGIYGGYLGSSADISNRGSINMAQGNVGGYATWFWNGFYVDASGGGGWSNYHTHRFALEAFDPVLGLDFGPFANGQTDGSEVNAMGAIGYDWHFDLGKPGCLNVGPIVAFQYTDVSLDQFTERGSLLPLVIRDQDEDSERLTAGARASLDIKTNNGILLRPEVRASWLREFSDQEYPIFARFATTSPTTPNFRADGPEIGRDGCLLGAGMTVQFSPSFGVFAFYDGVLGRNNYDLNSVSGGIQISF